MHKALGKLFILFALVTIVAGGAVESRACSLTDKASPTGSPGPSPHAGPADSPRPSPHAGPAELTEHPDFDVPLLCGAARKYKDPNDIADIPDEVIIEDFINIAFSDHEWASDYPWYDGKEKPFYSSDVRDRENGHNGQPWYSEENVGENYLVAGQYLKAYQGRAFPKQAPRPVNRINKVTQKQPYSVNLFADVGLLAGSFQYSNNAKDYEAHFAGLQDELSRLTGIRFEQKNSQFPETGNGIIIFNDWPFFKDVNFFKFREDPANLNAWQAACSKQEGYEFESDPMWSLFCATVPFYARHAFKTTTRFTPLLDTQVEGYFSSDTDNRIDGGECLIASNITLELRMTLTSECLVRQLGLPDGSMLFSSSAWDEVDFRGNALVSRFAGPFVHSVVPAGQAKSSIAPKYVYVADGVSGKLPLDAGMLAKFLPRQLTAYDRLMVRILYDERIKPGMTVEQAREVLPAVVRDKKSQIVNQTGK